MREGCRKALGTAMLFLVLSPGDREAEARPRGSVAIEKQTRTFKGWRDAVVHVPVVNVPGDRALQEKIQKSIGMSPEALWEEYEGWLTEVDYEIVYNKSFILSLTQSISGLGPYPDTHVTHVVIDLKTGERLAPADLFKSAALKDLAARLDKALKAEVAEALRSHAARPDAGELDLETLRANLGEASFTIETLDSFLVDGRGVTFFYDYGFVHAVEALEPAGRHFLSYAELRPYIEKSGPLGVFIR